MAVIVQPQPGPPVNAGSTEENVPAVQGTSLKGGIGSLSHGFGAGTGVLGTSGSGSGVAAVADSGTGLQATSTGGNAIHAMHDGDADSLPDLVLAETSSTQHAAVAAHNTGYGAGVWAFSQAGTALVATNDAPGTADADALLAATSAPDHAAVAAHNNAPKGVRTPSGYGVWASSNNTAIYGQGNPAGYFNGDVQVTGDVILLNPASADIAEDFDVEGGQANAEPGTVLIIGPSGRLAACTEPYDTRVAGVVSGAGDLKPAIVLQHLRQRADRLPLALVGKVLCKVDATDGPVAAGDLLTTSATAGHAMKVTDRGGAVGTILGKALRPLDGGRGLIPILVSLR